MDEEHQAHLDHLLATFKTIAAAKYRAGQKEHGGRLWEKFDTLDLLYQIRDEAIDQYVYVQTAIDQLEK